jgi:hypothetical protein
MDLITSLFDIDFSAFVPKLPVFLGLVRTLLVLVMFAGPVAMAVLGYFYLYRPTPEANFKFGFRTYFGMGSVQAWRYSQRIAGMVFGVLGIFLSVVSLIISLTFIGKDLSRIAGTAMVFLLCQLILVLAARVTVAILCAKHYDKNGNRRK